MANRGTTMTREFKRFHTRRVDEATRQENRETILDDGDFILPLFILDSTNREEAITSMPGIYRRSIDTTITALAEPTALGLKSVILFGVPDGKGVAQITDTMGTIPKAIRAIRMAYPLLEIICDVCICSYSEDGHCHIGENDATCELLAEIAVTYAHAGADIIAPSDMMDGRVHFIRQALDDAGLATPIMSYAAKYASNFYGPFRDAADCAPQHGDRTTYQMDPANSDEALEEIGADIDEGCESFIIKPALAYLDIIARARSKWPEREIVAYNVSGEYSMLELAVREGLLNKKAIGESLLAMKRAGVNRIISYWTEPYFRGEIE